MNSKQLVSIEDCIASGYARKHTADLLGDGHTYFYAEENLFAAPLFADGSADLEASVAVADFDFPLSAEDLAKVLAWFSRK